MGSADPALLRFELERMTHLEAMACANLDAEQYKVRVMHEALRRIAASPVNDIVPDEGDQAGRRMQAIAAGVLDRLRMR